MKKMDIRTIVKSIVLGFFCLNINICLSQNVAITDDDTYTVDASAMLDVKSLTKGLLIPRLTKVQRDAINSPATGLLIFQTDILPGVYIYEDEWKREGDNLGDHLATQNIQLSNYWLSNDGDDEGIAITNDGNVGIGTINPDAKLHVISENSEVAIFESEVGHAILKLKSESADYVSAIYGNIGEDIVGAIDFRSEGLTLWTNDLGGTTWRQRMIIKNTTGNVGIGTTTTSYKLTVAGDSAGISVSGGNDGDRLLEFKTDRPWYFEQEGDDAGTKLRLREYAEGGKSFFVDASGMFGVRSQDGSVYKMIVNNSGNIGIGTTTPIATLDINRAFANSSNDNLIGQNIYIAESSMSAYHTVTGLKIQTNPGGTSWASESDETGLHVTVRDGGDNCAIFENGKVGIGTLNPTAKLEVKADASSGVDDILFSVKDSDGNNVFVVYPESVQVIVPADPTKGSKRGAFVISGRGTTKTETNFMDMTKENYLIGHNVAPGITTGARNSILGYEAANSLTSGINNVVMGYWAGNKMSTANYNVYLGWEAGKANNSNANVMIGNGSGKYSTGGGNVYVGGTSGTSNVLGTNNVMIGYGAGGQATSGSGNVFIGHYAGLTESNSNKLYIDNTNTSSPLIYGDFSLGFIEFNAIVYMPDVYSNSISSTYRDLYIKSDGQLGYISSSKRYKENIINMEDISWLYQLRPVNFTYKSDTKGRKSYGLIAEEVEKVNKVFVSYNDDGSVETVLYSQLISPMLKAIQEQQKQIEEKDNEIRDLKKRLEAVEEYINNQTK